MGAMSLLMEFLIGSIEAFATLLLTIFIFRIPFRPIFFHVVSLSFVISGFSFLLYYLWELPIALGELFIVILHIVFFGFIVHLKLWQSALISLIGFVSGGIIFSISFFLLTSFNVIYGDLESTSIQGIINLMTIQFVYSVVVFQVCFLLFKYRLGYLLLKEKLTFKEVVKPIYIKLFSVIIISLFIMIYVAHISYYDSELVNIGKLLVLVLFSCSSLVIVYFFNRHNLNNEFKRIKENIRL